MTDIVKFVKVKTGKSPEVYTRTVKASALAFVKLTETFAGCFALWYFISHMDAVPNVLVKLLEIRTDGESEYASVWRRNPLINRVHSDRSVSIRP